MLVLLRLSLSQSDLSLKQYWHWHLKRHLLEQVQVARRVNHPHLIPVSSQLACFMALPVSVPHILVFSFPVCHLPFYPVPVFLFLVGPALITLLFVDVVTVFRFPVGHLPVYPVLVFLFSVSPALIAHIFDDVDTSFRFLVGSVPGNLVTSLFSVKLLLVSESQDPSKFKALPLFNFPALSLP